MIIKKEAGLTRRKFVAVGTDVLVGFILGETTNWAIGAPLERSPKDDPAPITLALKGRTAYTILVSAQASEAESFAAQELQSYLNRIVGIRVASSPPTTLPRLPMVLWCPLTSWAR